MSRYLGADLTNVEHRERMAYLEGFSNARLGYPKQPTGWTLTEVEWFQAGQNDGKEPRES